MNPLSMYHRKQLERIVGAAHQVAGRGASAAVEALAVQHREPQADPARIEAVVGLEPCATARSLRNVNSASLTASPTNWYQTTICRCNDANS